MEYVNIQGSSELYRISITLPKLEKGFRYNYPQGRIYGFFKKEVYYVEYYNGLLDKWIEIKTPKDYIEKFGKEDEFFVDEDGRIRSYGVVSFRLKSTPGEKIEFRYETISDLIKYLEKLSYRWGIDLNHYICLDSKEAKSLYESKEEDFKPIERQDTPENQVREARENQYPIQPS